MINRLVLLFAVLGAFASYASASAEAKPAALGHEAPTPSTLTISVTISPSTSGGQASTETMTITLNPSPDPGPAFSAPPAGGSPEPAVPDVDPPCHSMDALVSSCTTQTSFWGLPLSAQAQCLCNVGPWDAVVAACFSELTVDGQYYASSITSHGLLGLCSSYKAGPTWPASVLASISALDNTGTPAPSTPAPVTTGTATAVGTGIPTKSTTSSTVSPLPNAASALVRPSLETWGSLLVSLLPWLFGL